MKLLVVYTAAYLFSLSVAQSFNSNLHKYTNFNNYLEEESRILIRAANESNGVKEAQKLDSLVHDYILVKIKQNSIKALRKLTQSWKIIPRRVGRQDEAGALVDVVSSSEQTIASIGAGFKIADTVIHSLVSILRTVFGGIPYPGKPPAKAAGPPVASQGAVKAKPTPAPEKYFRDFRALDSKYNYLHNSAKSLRDKTYSEQLSGALSILTAQYNAPQLKRENIKSTVDYILDIYIATNGKPQALFLPQLFDGIPREP